MHKTTVSATVHCFVALTQRVVDTLFETLHEIEPLGLIKSARIVASFLRAPLKL